MGALKNDVGRPANKKRLLKKIILALFIIIILILLVVGIYLYINRFPYRGYAYEDDWSNIMHFHKNGKYSLSASDAGNDLSECENERYFYNKKQNKLNLYCGFKLVEQLQIIEINENDFVYKYVDIKHPDNEGGVWHMKKGTTYYSEYSSSYESRMNQAGNDVINKLVGKAFYFESNYLNNKKISVIVYFKDKDTILYNFNGNTYKVNPYFEVYSGKMIDIEISFCGSLTIIYDIENDRIVYTNAKQKNIKNIKIDMSDIKNEDEGLEACDEIAREIYKDQGLK